VPSVLLPSEVPHGDAMLNPVATKRNFYKKMPMIGISPAGG